MTSYIINSTDDNGVTNVDVTIGDKMFNQNLLLPTDPTEAKATLEEYVTDYAVNLVAQDKQNTTDAPVPTLLQPLIGVEQSVTLDTATTAYVDANFVEVVSAEVPQETVL